MFDKSPAPGEGDWAEEPIDSDEQAVEIKDEDVRSSFRRKWWEFWKM